MNKIEELEKQLNEEISKIQVNLKEKHKWIVGKYVKYNDHNSICSWNISPRSKRWKRS